MGAAEASYDPDTGLYDASFCVVDLETTGGSPARNRVTEIGAVRVRRGEVTGELATLVDPGVPIPAPIVALTGITDALVADRPPFEAVLPAFLEFAAGCVLVAHNARFDTAFLAAALERLDYPPLAHPVVCTAALARRLVRDEVRDCRLATLAQHFRSRTVPVHRALVDARATVDVLHGLLERAGSFGVTTLAELLELARVSDTERYAARRLAADLPAAPGVYRFVSEGGEVLYVGKATDLRRRVRSYFGSDERRTTAALIRETGRIEHDLCPTPLEAEVVELRAIHGHLPRYNRRSRRPRRPVFVKLTAERFPRLSLARVVRADGGAYLGPLPSRAVAERIVEALCDAAPIRRCTERITARTRFPACALAGMGRCPAPCEGQVEPEAYAVAIAPVTSALSGDPATALSRLEARMARLAAGERFEEAARVRRRAEALVAALRRDRRVTLLRGACVLVAARDLSDGRVELVAVRDGRLAGSARCAAADRGTEAARLRAVPPPPDVAAPTAASEAELVARWLEQPGVRVLHAEGPVAEPVAGGSALAAAAALLARARAQDSGAGALARKQLHRKPAPAVA